MVTNLIMLFHRFYEKLIEKSYRCVWALYIISVRLEISYYLSLSLFSQHRVTQKSLYGKQTEYSCCASTKRTDFLINDKDIFNNHIYNGKVEENLFGSVTNGFIEIILFSIYNGWDINNDTVCISSFSLAAFIVETYD
jgi:hypothetical protein